MQSPPNDLATKEDIRLLLDRLEGYHRLTDKRIGLTQVRIVESEERVKRHIDLAARRLPAAPKGPLSQPLR